jgi:hypothetical protein
VKAKGAVLADAASGQVTMNLAARCPQDMRPDVRVLCGHLTIMTAWPDHTCEMDQSGDLVSRKAESLVTEALADTRVVTLNGARQVGKSTLARITLAGLRHLAQRLGPRLIAGYVLYTGQQTLPFGDRLRALPIDALWNSER